jgi:hypothetical protein
LASRPTGPVGLAPSVEAVNDTIDFDDDFDLPPEVDEILVQASGPATAGAQMVSNERDVIEFDDDDEDFDDANAYNPFHDVIVIDD